MIVSDLLQHRLRAIALLLVLPALGACDDDGVGPRSEVPFESLLSSDPVVALNPSGRAPLVAEIRLATTEATTVSYTLLGTGDDEPLEREVDGFGRDHSLPVLGLLPGRSNEVEVRLVAESGARAADTFLIQADPLPDFAPAIEITVRETARMEPGWTLSTLVLKASHTMPIIFDEQGRIRWYMEPTELTGLFLPMERLSNGNLVAGFAEIVHEFDMVGNVVERWVLPGFLFHHDVIEKPDGNLIVATDRADLGTVEDHIIELERPSGEIVRVWDLRQILDVDRFDLVEDPSDWLHVNSVWYDETDGGLIISARHQGVFKVSEDNDLLWILAPHRGWGPAGPDGDGHETSDFLLTAVDATGTPYPAAVQDGAERTDDFDWPWGQHAAMPLPNGNILLLDNGFRRQFATAPDPPYTRGVEYEIDVEAGTVRQVWAYGRERGASFHASFVSDIDFLATTENRLVMPGITNLTEGGRGAWVTEVTPDGSLAFEAKILFTESYTGGGGPDFVYRSERLPLFPD